MSDNKRNTTPAKGGRKKPRSKADKTADKVADKMADKSEKSAGTAPPLEELAAVLEAPAVEAAAPAAEAAVAEVLAPPVPVREPLPERGPFFPRQDRGRDRSDEDDNIGNRAPGGARFESRGRDFADSQPKHAAPREREPVVSQPEKEQGAGARYGAADEYMLQTYFDRSARNFVALVAEFPELKAQGSSRELAVRELELKLENHVESLKRRSETLPEAYAAKKYPEKIELRLSQSLQRRLDVLSRFERVPVEQLLIELLTAGVDKKLDTSRRDDRRPQPQQQQQERRHQQPERGNARHQPQQHHGRRHGGMRNQEVLENRENFMEYVRNLEKGGGAGGWRKK